MREAHSVEQVRAAEAALMAVLPDGALMRRAAAGLAATCAGLVARVYGTRTVLLVGSGDNGGDALYAGARLARRGARVDALLLSPARAHAAGLEALRGAGGRCLPADAPGFLTDAQDLVGAADLVIDGIVGIGGRGALRAPADLLAEAAEASRAVVVAVDLPSGVDADTGAVPGAAVRADVTVTFGTHKPGLLVDPGASYAGVVTLVDIGLEPPAPVLRAVQHADVARLLPRPARESDKYARGVLGLVVGSERYPGAAVLAAGAALRGGAGALRYLGPRAVGETVLRAHPEVMVGAGRVQAYAVGSGLDTGEEARERFAAVPGEGVPVLVDADGLTLLAEMGPNSLNGVPGVLLTPHAGEAVRLFEGLGAHTTRDEVEAERIGHATRLAAAYRATVLLKGSTTVIADPRGEVWANPTGTPYLATAGSGDVLTGLTGALLAAGRTPTEAAVCGAYLHGLAGRLASAAGTPCAAGDVAAALPEAWRAVRGSGA
ncbi:NAD(P)H-hydrate dehydratase [Yinghuangia sp. ASG 101]|uniref:NAD(P)H-hydrate dehydratase n=1 Tax=Yinghuangia sp. ASG 101 TaxID=2896848 RepID=UPI001E561BED|nr:NAD(P)H-hydrate dehydratase [Yinghuangia sp. ASG 101]UGQ15406.1 NAD(P)H-hydrate dehydratase [Yinghuangia sp. ASG 101]